MVAALRAGGLLVGVGAASLAAAPLRTPMGSPLMDLPRHCSALSATATDPGMLWLCQASWVHKCSGQHIACVPAIGSTKPAPQGLVIFLPGTALTPQDYSLLIQDVCVARDSNLPSLALRFIDHGLHRVACRRVWQFSLHGYLALGLFYPSGEGQNGCGASRSSSPTDLNCTALERQRVLTGEEHLSDKTNVTKPDSIVNRIGKALGYLGGPWSRWLDNAGAPRWSDITIAGHSNGADHAGILAKTFHTRRAIFFSGPNDYVGPSKYGHPSTPAPWQFAAGATPPTSMFGFGLCGNLPRSGAMPECFDWRPAWSAQGLPGPWFRADGVLGNASAMVGFHRLCSNGSLVTRGDMHMAAAADCCVPRRKTDGRIVWTDVVAHMLVSDGSAPVALRKQSGEADSDCACAWSTRERDLSR